MGGQACILYGAAEFSRDIDLAILTSAENLSALRATLEELQAKTVYVPQLSEDALLGGHACHFRCGASGVEGLRIDVMAKLRGVADFPKLWERRVVIDLPGVGLVPVMALEDLVRSKKTQRDKDWPMIRRLIEADYHRHRTEATADRVRFWLAECRTEDILQALTEQEPELAREVAARRPLLNRVLTRDRTGVTEMLREEEDRERQLDREYWAPLRRQLEAWRHEAR